MTMRRFTADRGGRCQACGSVGHEASARFCKDCGARL